MHYYYIRTKRLETVSLIDDFNLNILDTNYICKIVDIDAIKDFKNCHISQIFK